MKIVEYNAKLKCKTCGLYSEPCDCQTTLNEFGGAYNEAKYRILHPERKEVKN